MIMSVFTKLFTKFRVSKFTNKTVLCISFSAMADSKPIIFTNWQVTFDMRKIAKFNIFTFVIVGTIMVKLTVLRNMYVLV